MPKLTYTQTQIADLFAGLNKTYGHAVTREQVLSYIAKHKLPMPYFLFKDPARRAGRGMYSVVGEAVRDSRTARNGTVAAAAPVMASARPAAAHASADLKQVSNGPATMTLVAEDLVPEKDATFVPFGFYKDLESIIASKRFCPIYITGLSGNGKTFQAEQACANLKREAIRIPITEETDEEDLIGGPTLVDGSIVQKDGLVLVAMRRGAV